MAAGADKAPRAASQTGIVVAVFSDSFSSDVDGFGGLGAMASMMALDGVSVRSGSADTMFDLANLYRQHRAYVRACLLSCRVPTCALDDAIQDVFVVVFRRLADYDQARASLRAWLFGISLRVARQHRRHAGRRDPATDCLGAEEAIVDPERYVSRLEAADLAHRLLDRLPREQLSVLVLADVEEMTGPEIAQALGLAIGTVHSRLSRARKRLGNERRRAAAEQGLDSRPWFAVLATRLPTLPAARSGLAMAAFVSVRTLLALVAVGVVAALALWLNLRETAPLPPDVSAAAEQGPPKLDPNRFAGGVDGSTHHTVKLRTSSISGVVTADTGGPVANARTCAWLVAENLLTRETRVPQCVQTDGHGRYTLNNLMPSRYQVTAGAELMMPGQFDTGSSAAFFALARDEKRTGVDIVLSRGGVKLRGSVADVTGGPVSGAVVMVRSAERGNPLSDGAWGSSPPVLSHSDDDGVFELWVRPGTLAVVATADGYARAESFTVAPGASASLVMTPESVLSGQIVDRSTKAPVEGALVAVGGDGPMMLGGQSTLSDSNGNFRIGGLHPGRYRPRVSATGRLGDASASVELGLGQHLDGIVVELIPAPLVAGTVEIESGKGCTNGVVALQGKASGQSFATTTDTNGRVVFDAVLPGDYDVLVACQGYTRTGPPPKLTVADRDLSDQRWTVSPGVSVRGILTDPEGQPVAHTPVSGYATMMGNAIPMSARSDADGRFVLEGATPGPFVVEAHHPTLGKASKSGITIEDRDVEVELQMPATSTIRGTVLTSGGEPQAGLEVTARFPMHRTVTLDDGSFEFAGVAPGAYSVGAQRSFGDQIVSAQVTVVSSQPAEVELIVPERDAVITGVVRDQDGAPAADAIVTALPDSVMESRGRKDAMGNLRDLSGFGRGKAPVLTDADGRFEVQVASDETFTVLAQRRGGGDAWKSGVAVSDEVILQIPPRAALGGRVVTNEGSPATGLSIRLRNKNSGAALNETFYYDEGDFRFEDLDAGTYELVAVAKEGRARAEVTLTDQDRANLALTLVGGVTVRGQVIDARSSEPVADMVVIIGPEDDKARDFAAKAERAFVFSKKGLKTDAAGRFVVHDVPPGVVRVMVLPEKLGKGPYGMAMFVVATAGFDPVNELQAIPIVPVNKGPSGASLPPAVALVKDGPWCSDSPVVDAAEPGSSAAAAGLSKGTVITSIDGLDVSNRRCHLATRLLELAPGASVEVTTDDGQTHQVQASPES